MGRSIGVDLHKNSFTVCYYRNEKECRERTYRVSQQGLAAFKKVLRAEDEVAVESTGNTKWAHYEEGE